MRPSITHTAENLQIENGTIDCGSRHTTSLSFDRLISTENENLLSDILIKFDVTGVAPLANVEEYNEL